MCHLETAGDCATELNCSLLTFFSSLRELSQWFETSNWPEPSIHSSWFMFPHIFCYLMLRTSVGIAGKGHPEKRFSQGNMGYTFKVLHKLVTEFK